MNKTEMVSSENALPGGHTPVLAMPFFHRVTGDRLDRPFPSSETIYLAPNPTYREVYTGCTGHAETVRVTYDPTQVSTEAILTIFLENHDPTQGMRQGNDVGTQYRSAIWCTTTEQFMTATTVKGSYQANLLNAGYGAITTAISMANGVEFYLAEAEHQQYLEDNPFGYCPVHATGVCLAGS